ncbi:hypothetical protein [Marinospirillum perlucidum]|uniref:hypothetical protein n=1 Tax=Marinospirillum perlucidum TaxID=1982602 RepID=UPI000DF39C46|nr:hypothetical protein [Marinospirillum perlucidum]
MIDFFSLRLIGLLCLFWLLAGCGGGSDSGSNDNLNPQIVTLQGAQTAAPREMTGLERVSDETWDETAVRKVLHLFAYGSHATDAQIQA